MSDYDDLAAFLSASHEVIEFSFDWRRPIEEEAVRLAGVIDQALSARATTGQPVRLIAHSMGGVVARTVQLERPDVWQRWLERPGSRLLMLGTPNGGSFAPMQVLSGDDTMGNALAAFGLPFQDHKARRLMAAMPGFMQLQMGLLDPALGLAQSERWQALAEQDMKALEIAAKHCAGRKPDEVLFPITDARKTLKWINAKAKTHVQGHGLRDTFASIAEELVSGGLLKRMLNHSVAGDVTLGHYVGKSEAQLRAGWQTVADFIEAAALEPKSGDVQVVAGAAKGNGSVGTPAHTGLAR